jgi:MSHA biogenesis protein MshQ
MSLRRRLRALLAAVLVGACGAAPAQSTYAPDASPGVAAAHPWIDLGKEAASTSLADEAVSGPIDIGFAFPFGGGTHATLRIASNGMLQFGGTTSPLGANSRLPLTGQAGEPAIDAVMAPLWDDLNPDGDAGHVHYATLGSAPQRVFVVSWLAVPYWCHNDNPRDCNPAKRLTKNASATFQVQLHEAGHFVYRYQQIDGAGGAHTGGATFRNPAGASVGYEIGDGDFVQYAFRTASVPAGTAILWSRRNALPGRFNAFDPATPAGALAGVIRTQVAGAPFTVAVVALDAARTVVQTDFTGTVKVELLDARDSGGALDEATACRASWTPIPGRAAQTLTFTAADRGRRAMTLSGEPEAWRDVRVRMSYPATGTPTSVGCSTDNFALRPARFDGPLASDTDSRSPGTGRALANLNAAGGAVHRAGRPFTVRAVAVNAAGAVTANYAGLPVASIGPCTGAACGGALGTLLLSTTAVAGVLADPAATYSEAGAFALQLEDTTFADADAGDGSSDAERTIASAVANVGRFVPDRFELEPLIAPVLATFGDTACATRSFTYVGQPFGWASAPQAVVRAVAADGTPTANYAGPLWKLSPAGLAQAYGPLAPAQPGLDTGGIGAPLVVSNGDGTGVVAAALADRLRFVRPAGAPSAPFDADITLAWRATDDSEAAVAGNGTIDTPAPLVFPGIAFDAGAAFRYGVLRLANAYGSELTALPVVVEAQWWNGQGFVVNAADHCTALPATSVAFAGWQRGLAACETGLAPTPLRLAAGRGFFTLRRPGAGNAGSVDLALQLAAPAAGQTCGAAAAPVAAVPAALAWLRGRWNGAAGYDADPRARASFGQYRSPLLHLREVF